MTLIDLAIDQKNIDSSFLRIAEELLNKNILVSGESKFRICEIEFYYRELRGGHQDPYTHCHIQQKTSGQWYQHGSGLDITFGNEDAYGGILIRAIQSVNGQDNKKYIYGPLKSLQALMTAFKKIEKQKVAFGFEKAEPRFLHNEIILKAPRAGLNPKLDPVMCNKPYRYFIFPKERHEPKGEIIASLRGCIEDEKLKELFGWKILPDKKLG